MSLERFQLPYLSTTQRLAIVIKSRDLVYDTDLQRIFVGDGVTLGGHELGVQGVAGYVGSDGSQGTQGIQGISIQGVQGRQGIQGTLGVQGTIGSQGIQGLNGLDGDDGTQGLSGIQGSQGVQGTSIQGIQGIQGISGSIGIDGSQGTTGQTGAQGTAGYIGADGSQGAQGIQGIIGSAGSNGSQGIQGTTGSGSQGIQGLIGTQGLVGTQGTQGTTTTLSKGTGSDIVTGTDDAKYITAKAIADAVGLGGCTGEWTTVAATFATTATCTFTGGTDAIAAKCDRSLFTCTDSTGNTRRIGYVKSSVNSSGTVTLTVVTDTDLASGDKSFAVALNRKLNDYRCLVTIPGQVIADTSYSQGMFFTDLISAVYLLPVDAAVLTAAAGTGAACAYNVYDNTTALFNTAPDLTTNATLTGQRPNTNTIAAGHSVSLRITSSAGATNFASDFQAKLFLVPQSLFLST